MIPTYLRYIRYGTHLWQGETGALCLPLPPTRAAGAFFLSAKVCPTSSLILRKLSLIGWASPHPVRGAVLESPSQQGCSGGWLVGGSHSDSYGERDLRYFAGCTRRRRCGRLRIK